MIICITARAAGMDAPAEQRFARAPYFIFVNTETGESESVENPFLDAAGGVGPRAVNALGSVAQRSPSPVMSVGTPPERSGRVGSRLMPTVEAAV